jgi:hypothetical protein
VISVEWLLVPSQNCNCQGQQGHDGVIFTQFKKEALKSTTNHCGFWNQGAFNYHQWNFWDNLLPSDLHDFDEFHPNTCKPHGNQENSQIENGHWH